jgi:hypothetical protein
LSRLPRLVSIVLIGLLVSACLATAPAGTPVPRESTAPTVPAGLVLRIDHVGGWLPLQPQPWSIPELSVYGDGSLITGGPVRTVAPGPALPPLQLERLTPAGLAMLLQMARDAGLYDEPQTDIADIGIYDASTTMVTLNDADGEQHVTMVYALGMNVPADADPAAVAARTAIASFVAAVSAPSGTFAGEIHPAIEYDASGLRVFVRDEVPADLPEQPPVAWPLEQALASFGAPVDLDGGAPIRCGIVSGEDLDLLTDALVGANALTPWTDDGRAYSLIIRPLLPDDLTCDTTI